MNPRRTPSDATVKSLKNFPSITINTGRCGSRTLQKRQPLAVLVRGSGLDKREGVLELDVEVGFVLFHLLQPHISQSLSQAEQRAEARLGFLFVYTRTYQRTATCSRANMRVSSMISQLSRRCLACWRGSRFYEYDACLVFHAVCCACFLAYFNAL